MYQLGQFDRRGGTLTHFLVSLLNPRPRDPLYISVSGVLKDRQYLLTTVMIVQGDAGGVRAYN